MPTASLQRFVLAQDEDATFTRALAELRAGRKRSHWMWFVFPQLDGLGRSATARHFALADADEARQYLRHPVLGPRLRAACQAACESGTSSAEQLCGSVDALKLRSCATLFAAVAPDEPIFARVLDHFFGGLPDEATLQLLRSRPDETADSSGGQG